MRRIFWSSTALGLACACAAILYLGPPPRPNSTNSPKTPAQAEGFPTVTHLGAIYDPAEPRLLPADLTAIAQAMPTVESGVVAAKFSEIASSPRFAESAESNASDTPGKSLRLINGETEEPPLWVPYRNDR